MCIGLLIATGCGSQPVARPLIQPVMTPAQSPTHCTSSHGLPDSACTPGAYNPQVYQGSIRETICRTGWTSGTTGTPVRPPVSITDAIKVERMTAYGYNGQAMSTFELDHLIPLELGGATADVANLWPERWNDLPDEPGAHHKDVLETKLKADVCRGTITLPDAQQAMSGNWVDAYRHYIGPLV